MRSIRCCAIIPVSIKIRFLSVSIHLESGLELLMYFFTSTTSWAREFLQVKEDTNFKIMEILEKEG